MKYALNCSLLFCFEIQFRLKMPNYQLPKIKTVTFFLPKIQTSKEEDDFEDEEDEEDSLRDQPMDTGKES